MMKKIFFYSFISALFLLTSCGNDEYQTNKYTPKGTYDSGVLILNSGKPDEPNSSISYLSFDSSNFINNIYAVENNFQLMGTDARSMAINGDNAYIVLSGSNKIEIINRYSLKNIGTISTGLNKPQYIAFANNKAYVTNWADDTNANDDFVAVINLTTNTVSSSIPVLQNCEKIFANQNKLYVAHNNKSASTQITIIDAATDTKIGSPISLGYGPNGMAFIGNDLWVSYYGKSTVGEEVAGKLVKINLTTNQSVIQFPLSDNTKYIDNLQLYGVNLYYTVANKLYKFSPTELELPTAPSINFSLTKVDGFGISSNKVYVSDTGDLSANATVKVYSLGEGQDSPAIGTLLKTLTPGIGSNGFYFNQ